jgi:hypothetical protein
VKSKQFSDTSKFLKDPEDLEKISKLLSEDASNQEGILQINLEQL